MDEEIVTLGIEVKTDGVKQGAESLDKLAQAGARAEKSTAAMSDSAAKANAQIAAMAQKAQGAGNAFKPLDPASVSLSKIATEAQKANAQLSGIGNQTSKFEQIAKSADSAAGGINKAAQSLDEFQKEASSIQGIAGSLSAGFSSLAKLAGGLFAGVSIAAFAGKLVSVQREFDVLNSSLITITGSSANAEKELAWIKEFAAETPFSLAEVTQAFIKMKSLGLDASKESLTSYGNTASAMGKSLNQMIEAVADASTGEFERLKEFGIKAKQNGEQVSLTFQGVTTTIQNNAESISQYLTEIGNKNFFGAMEERAKTLDGAISNLGDTWDELFRTINQNNTGGLIYDSVKLATVGISDLIRVMKEMNSATGDAAKETGFFTSAQSGLATVFETVAVLGRNVKYVLVQIGNEIGGIAAQASAVARLDFRQAASIGQMMKDDARKAREELDKGDKRILAGPEPVYYGNEGRGSSSGKTETTTPKVDGASSDYLKLTQKMSGVSQDFYKNLKVLNDEYGRTGNLKNYQAEVKKLIETETQIGRDSVKKPGSGGGGGKSSSISDEAKEYAAAMKSLADIARDADKSTLDLSGSQQKLYDLMTSANWAKMPDSWKQTALAQFEAARAAELNAKFLKDVEAQSIKNVAANQAMFDQTQTLQKQAELYGMTASQISVMEESRLEDAIALATQNGAYPEHIAFLEQELEARKKLNAAYEENDLKRLLSGTKSQENKRKEADRATLDRGLASGKITKDEYDEAIAKFKESTDEMSEFSKQAARNMQDAMAEFFINPTKDGIEGMADSFGKTVQKMIAQAASAQLMNALFGDMGKTGKITGLVGSGLDWLKGTDFIKSFGFHDGGTVGAGDHSFTRMVPASIFNNAPRYHSGGIVGDEVPAILKKGERVLTKEQQQGMGNVVININSSNGDPAEIRRAAAAGARTALGAMNGARRYG